MYIVSILILQDNINTNRKLKNIKIITFSISSLLLIFFIAQGMEKYSKPLPVHQFYKAVSLQDPTNYGPILPCSSTHNNNMSFLLEVVQHELEVDASTTLMNIISRMPTQQMYIDLTNLDNPMQTDTELQPSVNIVEERNLQISPNKRKKCDTYDTQKFLSKLYIFNKKKGAFCCKVSSFCKKSFLSLHSLTNHIKNNHPQQPIVYCEKQNCSQIFAAQHALDKHTAQEHQETSLIKILDKPFTVQHNTMVNNTVVPAYHPMHRAPRYTIIKQFTECYKRNKPA